MPVNVFDKVLKIIQIVVTLLQMALKAFTGISDEESDDTPDLDDIV